MRMAEKVIGYNVKYFSFKKRPGLFYLLRYRTFFVRIGTYNTTDIFGRRNSFLTFFAFIKQEATFIWYLYLLNMLTFRAFNISSRHN